MSDTADQPLWIPSLLAADSTQLAAFRKEAARVSHSRITDYAELHAWSVREPEAFWNLIWDFCDVRGEKGASILRDGQRMPGAQFFPDARLNFTENLLRTSGSRDAIVFKGEGTLTRRLSWDELRATVSKLQQYLRAHGVGPGDRVAAVLPNMPEAIAAMLATASLGAVWASCSPDFGSHGILDRFAQIEPVLLIVADGYSYNGKLHNVGDKIRTVAASLPSVRATIVVDHLGEAAALAAELPSATTFKGALEGFETKPMTYLQLPFAHPLYILFSSGTTGKPKCIVHSAGGTLLQHLKEHRLHADIRESDRVFYFTTCAWMMWNWLASSLASGATILLYDGAPSFANGDALFDFVQEEGATHFGTSAKFIDTVRKNSSKSIKADQWPSLRMIMSTGSPLSADCYKFVYSEIKREVHLASMSGGTDIVSCFVLGIPTQPVWAGEIQGAGLGMAVEIWDDEGRPLATGKGELVCTKPFPSMPLRFWNDADGSRYHNAYFARFQNVWCHGDFAEWTEHGGVVIHGRSDATLNPGGVRIGTAEIYRQVEEIPEIIESLCIGQEFEGDTRVVLFVRLAQNVALNSSLEDRIRSKLRTGASPRHVPAKIIAVSDIPRTKTGKISELSVRDVVHGRPVNYKEALANPEALELFRDLPDLRS